MSLKENGPRAIRPSTPMSRMRLIAFLVFFVICALCGGSSRVEAEQLIIVRLASILSVAVLILTPGTWNWRPLKPLIVLSAAFAAAIAVQLIPLPPAIWSRLPGHEVYLQAAALQGLTQPWRPISIAPDLTLNSLFSLIPVGSVLLCFAGIEKADRRILVFAILAVVLASVLLGLVQIASSVGGLAYFYRPTSLDLPVGLFANRNHQAAFLAIGMVIAGLWLPASFSGRPSGIFALWGGIALSILFLTMTIVTGSRAGAGIGVVLLMPVIWPGVMLLAGRLQSMTGVPQRIWSIASLALPIAFGAALLWLGRSGAIDRAIEGGSPDGEMRLRAIPVLWTLAKAYFPFGFGFGAFDDAFRRAEPDSLLRPTFFNHAHNDIFELVLSGGLPAAMVLVAFLIWAIRGGIRIWSGASGSSDWMAARAASVMLAILAAASVADYPLRTPLLATVFAMSACWLAIGIHKKG